MTDLNRRQLLRNAAGAAGTVFALPGLAAILSGCADASGATTAEGRHSLVIASGATPVTLDPMVSLDGQSPLLWRMSYETLLRFQGSGTDLGPHLAEAFEVSEDGLTITFHLRDGIVFSDGAELDAAAVKLNLERQIALKQGIAYALTPIAKVETPDARTVVVRAKEFSDGLLSGFASLYGLYLVSPKALTDHKGGDWAQAYLRSHMAGTGPYVLDGYQQSQRALFARNERYWRGWSGSHLDRVLVKYVSEPSSERLAAERGETDIALFLPDDVVEGMKGKPGVRITNEPTFNLYYLGLPCKKGLPTADKRVRQALSYGFDYKTWVDDVLQRTGAQAHGAVPSNFVEYSPEVTQYTYDPDRARKLLADAGHDGGGFTLKYTFETGYFWKRPLGEQFQANMNDLGVKVEIQELSPSTWAALMSNPDRAEHAFGLAWWPSLATPFDYLWTLFATDAQGTAGYNWTYYSNPAYDKLLYAASAEADPVKRKALYAHCQQLVVDDAPALFLNERRYRLPIRTNVDGFTFNGMYIETFDEYALHKS
jgi:peptide/nickel transport system substrate-binding protein